MQSVEDFLRDYFRSRTDLLRTSEEGWQAHIRQFFALDYHPFDPTWSGTASEQEQILSTRASDGLSNASTHASR